MSTTLIKFREQLTDYAGKYARSRMQGYAQLSAGALFANSITHALAGNYAGAGVYAAVALATHFFAAHDATKLVDKVDEKIEEKSNEKAFQKLKEISSVSTPTVPLTVTPINL